MDTTAIINGIFAFVLAMIIKFVFKKDESRYLERLFYAFQIKFKKGDVLSAASFLQLLGLLWLIIGIFENLFGNTLKNLPGPVLLAGELFIPLLITIIIAKNSYR